MNRRAFTLLEMMLAMTIGLAVVLVSVTAFNAASRAMKRANRIAVQNQLLLAGVWYALDDMDGWDSLNDPADPRNPARRPRLHLTAPGTTEPDARPFNEIAPGYAVGPFRASDPKWWYGYRSINAPRERFAGGVTAPQLPDWERFGTISDPDATRRFLHTWPYHVGVRLGLYGLLDYLPPGVPIAVASVGSWTPSGVTGVQIHDVGWLYPIKVKSGEYSDYPLTAMLGDEQAVAIITSDFGSGVTPVTNGYNRRVYLSATAQSTIVATNPFYRLFTADVAALRVLPVDAPPPASSSAPVGPQDWPQVEVAVYRLIRRGVHHNLGVIRVQDPISGESLATTISSIATTLRGARVERGLDILP